MMIVPSPMPRIKIMSDEEALKHNAKMIKSDWVKVVGKHV
jgi:hypothetical protein